MSAQWSDGQFTEIPAEELKVTGYDKSKPGTQTLTVTWTKDGKTFKATFDVVVKPQPERGGPVPNPVDPDDPGDPSPGTPAPEGPSLPAPRPGMPRTDQ